MTEHQNMGINYTSVVTLFCLFVSVHCVKKEFHIFNKESVECFTLDKFTECIKFNNDSICSEYTYEYLFNDQDLTVDAKLHCPENYRMKLINITFMIPKNDIHFCRTQNCEQLVNYRSKCSCCATPSIHNLCKQTIGASIYNQSKQICKDQQECNLNFQAKNFIYDPTMLKCIEYSDRCQVGPRLSKCYSRWINVSYECKSRFPVPITTTERAQVITTTLTLTTAALKTDSGISYLLIAIISLAVVLVVLTITVVVVCILCIRSKKTEPREPKSLKRKDRKSQANTYEYSEIDINRKSHPNGSANNNGYIKNANHDSFYDGVTYETLDDKTSAIELKELPSSSDVLKNMTDNTYYEGTDVTASNDKNTTKCGPMVDNTYYASNDVDLNNPVIKITGSSFGPPLSSPAYYELEPTHKSESPKAKTLSHSDNTNTSNSPPVKEHTYFELEPPYYNDADIINTDSTKEHTYFELEPPYYNETSDKQIKTPQPEPMTENTYYEGEGVDTHTSDHLNVPIPTVPCSIKHSVSQKSEHPYSELDLPPSNDYIEVNDTQLSPRENPYNEVCNQEDNLCDENLPYYTAKSYNPQTHLSPEMPEYADPEEIRRSRKEDKPNIKENSSEYAYTYGHFKLQGRERQTDNS